MSDGPLSPRRPRVRSRPFADIDRASEPGDALEREMVMRTCLIALACLGWVAAPAIGSACTPPPDHIERWQEYEDQHLRRATLLFRGVIEDFQQPDGQYGDATMVIRRTRSSWGRGSPERIVIPREYFFSCARGNLHAAVDMWGEHPGFPRVRNGLSVTLIGRAEDASAPWDFVILVDGTPDTQRVLRRFRELKRAR